jgi:uncharacterized protein (DUF58 family)
VAIVLICVCLRLGWWQWDRARSAGGTAQNLGYALQWPAFGAFVVYAWIRMFRLELHPPAEPGEESDQPAATAEPTASPRPTVQVRRHYQPATDAAPTAPSPDEPSDEQLAAYNAYLADLSGPSRNQPRRTSSP